MPQDPVYRLAAKDQIRRDEGLSLKLYKDSLGILTIGYGYNIQERGIKLETAEVWLDDDVKQAEQDALFCVPSFLKHNDARKAALINMAFNLGRNRFLGFKNFRAAMAVMDYKTAAKEMLDSLWAKQVGKRANRLAGIIERGE